jgi:hypothetical protein
MFLSFFDGLLTGFNSSPVVKYGFISLIVVVIVMKITKWWGNFRNKV